MELEAGVLVSATTEGPVIEGEIVTAIRERASRGIEARRSHGRSGSYVTPPAVTAAAAGRGRADAAGRAAIDGCGVGDRTVCARQRRVCLRERL